MNEIIILKMALVEQTKATQALLAELFQLRKEIVALREEIAKK